MATKAADANALEQRLQGHLKLLINMLANATDLNLNNDQLAQVMGFKTGKNIPRKINEVVRPYGFLYMGGRVVPADGTTTATATATDSADSDHATGAADTASSPAPKARKPKTTPRKKTAKKRKLEEDDDDKGRAQDADRGDGNQDSG